MTHDYKGRGLTAATTTVSKIDSHKRDQAVSSVMARRYARRFRRENRAL